MKKQLLTIASLALLSMLILASYTSVALEQTSTLSDIRPPEKLEEPEPEPDPALIGGFSDGAGISSEGSTSGSSTGGTTGNAGSSGTSGNTAGSQAMGQGSDLENIVMEEQVMDIPSTPIGDGSGDSKYVRFISEIFDDVTQGAVQTTGIENNPDYDETAPTIEINLAEYSNAEWAELKENGIEFNVKLEVEHKYFTKGFAIAYRSNLGALATVKKPTLDSDQIIFDLSELQNALGLFLGTEFLLNLIENRLGVEIENNIINWFYSLSKNLREFNTIGLVTELNLIIKVTPRDKSIIQAMINLNGGPVVAKLMVRGIAGMGSLYNDKEEIQIIFSDGNNNGNNFGNTGYTGTTGTTGYTGSQTSGASSEGSFGSASV